MNVYIVWNWNDLEVVKTFQSREEAIAHCKVQAELHKWIPEEGTELSWLWPIDGSGAISIYVSELH